jgi:hypothetical protein
MGEVEKDLNYFLREATTAMLLKSLTGARTTTDSDDPPSSEPLTFWLAHWRDLCRLLRRLQRVSRSSQRYGIFASRAFVYSSSQI